MELRGPYEVAITQDTANFTNIFSISNVRRHHSGNYYCTAITKGPSLSPSLAVRSNYVYRTIGK